MLIKEFKALYDLAKAASRDLKQESLDILYAFKSKLPHWEVYIFFKFDCPDEECSGHGIMSSFDPVIKNIKCIKCGRRIDSRRNRKK